MIAAAGFEVERIDRLHRPLWLAGPHIVSWRTGSQSRHPARDRFRHCLRRLCCAAILQSAFKTRDCARPDSRDSGGYFLSADRLLLDARPLDRSRYAVASRAELDQLRHCDEMDSHGGECGDSQRRCDRTWRLTR